MTTRPLSQTGALRRLENGYDLCNHLTLRAELTNLCHLHEVAFTSSSFCTHPTTSPQRNAHIVSIAASSDKCLAAIASSDGRCEIHEPTADDDTLRVTLSAQARLSTVAFFQHADIVATATSDNPALYAYDLNKCSSDMPTTSIPLTAQTKPLTDLAPLQWPICAGVRPGQLALFDFRVPSSSSAQQQQRYNQHTNGHHRGRTIAQMVSASAIPFSDPVVMSLSATWPTPASTVSTEDLLFVAEGEHIFAFDRRRLPSMGGRAGNKTSSSSIVMGGYQPQTSYNKPLHRTPSLTQTPAQLARTFGAVSVRRLPGARRGVSYNWLSAMSRGAPGILAFHGTDGTFGVLDWMSGKVESVRESSSGRPTSTGVMNHHQQQGHNVVGRRRAVTTTTTTTTPSAAMASAELVTYGASARLMGESLPSTWYIRRRRGDVVVGSDGRGWRALLPNMTRTGLRMVAFGATAGDLTHFDVPAVRQHDVACVHAVDGQLNKLVVGTTRNEVIAFKVDIDRTIRQAREEQEEERRVKEEEEEEEEINRRRRNGDRDGGGGGSSL